jgi:hypothetical protein
MRGKPRWKINRKRKILVSNSDFGGKRCNKPKLCDGWKLTGLHQTEVTKSGNHVLHMQTTIKAPYVLDKGKMKQTWAISETEGANKIDSKTEVFSCIWNS